MWGKTVMSEDVIRDKLPLNDGYSYYMAFGEAVAKAQAELTGDIAFKAGEAQAEQILTKVYADAKQAGIRKVVEWIESNHTLVEKRLDWQAQKYEWGIKEAQ